MATDIKTVMTYPLNGTTTDFNVPFEYLARKFVRVTLIGQDRKELILNQDYRFATKSTISTTRRWGPTDGYSLIEIRRYTSATERLVDFTDGSILRAYDLNISQIQTLHVAEEARDLTADTIGVNNNGDLDARGRRIVNVADAKDPGDAVTYGQFKKESQGAWNARNQAEQFKNQAQGFRNEAENFKNQANTAQSGANSWANWAKKWATQSTTVEGNLESSKTYSERSATSATASANSAKTAEAHKNEAARQVQLAKNEVTNAANEVKKAQAEVTRATQQADRAKTEADRSAAQVPLATEQANRAKTEADRAKTEADKLGNMNEFAKIISVSGNDVKFKGKVDAVQYHTDDSIVISEPASAGPGLPAAMDWYCALWRGANDKVGVVENGLRYQGKRMDMYQFNWDDPGTWPAGRSNGKGRHYFYGPIQTNGHIQTNGLVCNGTSATFKNIDVMQHVVFTPGPNHPAAGSWTTRSDWTWYNDRLQVGVVRGGSQNADYMLFRGHFQGVRDVNFQMYNNRFTMNQPLEVSGRILASHQGGEGFRLSAPGTNANYILAQDGGTNSWYVGRGSNGNNEVTLHSYKLNTNMSLRAGDIRFNKPIRTNAIHFDGRNGVIADDGNIKGDKWGGQWLDAWLVQNYYRRSRAWTVVWQGTAGGGVNMPLSQDIRFRQCWLRIGGNENRYMPVFFGPDGQYYVGGWGRGWIKLQLHGNGRNLKNVQDDGTIPTQVVVLNE